MSEINKLIDDLQDIVNKIANAQRHVFQMIIIQMSKEIKDKLDSIFEKFIVYIYTSSLLYLYTQAFWRDKDGFINFKLFKENTFPYEIDLTADSFSIISKSQLLQKQYSKEEIWKYNHYKLSKELSNSLLVMHNVMFIYMIHSSAFTVICDTGQTENLFMNKFLEDKFQKTIMDEVITEIQNIPQDTWNINNYKDLLKKAAEKVKERY